MIEVIRPSLMRSRSRRNMQHRHHVLNVPDCYVTFVAARHPKCSRIDKLVNNDNSKWYFDS